MDPALAGGTLPAPSSFHDGLGERRRISEAGGGDAVELLCLRRQLTTIPSFEFALRERAARLANFRHTYFGRVRNIDRLNDPGATLAVVSDVTRGVRLSQLLTPTEPRPVTIDINAALHLLRQLVSAVAMLHENAPDVAHGAIAPERIVVTSSARVVIVEYVLGAALEQLRYTPDQYWKELRVAVPPSTGAPRFDRRVDVTQIGVVALSLVLGRVLADDEYAHVSDVLASAWARSSRGGVEPMPPGLRLWIGRALQVDPRHPFESALDARVELDKVLDGEDEGEYEALQAAAPQPEPPAAVDVWEPYVPAPHPEEPKPVALTPEPKPVAPTPEPKPVVIAPEPKPVVIAPEPKPVALTPEPKPVALAPEPKPVVLAPEPKPMMMASQPAPIAVTPEPKPLVTPSDPPPAVVARDLKPGALAPERALMAFVPEPKLPAIAPEPKTALPLPEIQLPFAHAFDADREEGASGVIEDSLDAEPDVAPRKWARFAVAAGVLMAVSGAGVYGGRHYFAPPPPPVITTGVLTVSSNPAGAQIFVDNTEQGVTPLTLTLSAGLHIVELRGAGEPRTMPVTIAAGAQTSHYIELPAAAVAGVGSLQIRTEPAGAKVSVDGVARGRSPLLVEGLTPGDHTVGLESEFGTVKQTVTVQAATTASLVVPLTAGAAEGAPVSGWVSLAAPAELHIYENKRLLGTSKSDRIMVSAGRHELEIVSEALGYRASTIVNVSPGRIAPIKLEWPKGTMSLNALPWAEVWIDGEKSGETPLGNLSVPIGPHEIIFRHPDFGEQRYAVTVSLNAPARVSVDLRKEAARRP